MTAWLVPLWIAAAAACDVDAALGRLPVAEQLHCAMTQTKRSPIFKRPVEQRGLLWARADGAFRLDVSAPQQSSLKVSGGKAVWQTGSTVEVLPLDKLPRMQSLLSSLAGAFTGRTARLRESFTLSALCDATGVSLSLTPRDASLGFIQSMRLRIEGAQLVAVLVTESNGDSSELRLSDCSTRPFAKDPF